MDASHSGRSSGGKGWHDSQLATDDAQGMREGEPAGVDVLAPGRLVHQSPDGPMGQHHPVKLLLHELWCLAAQHHLAAAQMGFELVEHAFDFPALRIEGGQLLRRQETPEESLD